MGAIRFSIDPGLVRALLSELPLKAFVETGTYEGDSVRAVLPLFDEIHTIEVSDELHQRAAEAFQKEPQVHVHHGRSEEVLKELAPKLSGRRKTLFWLDAHWSDEPGASEHDRGSPLLEELAAIGSLGPDSVVMIDDARLFLAPPPPPSDPEDWPALEEVLSTLGGLSKKHEPMVIDDVIVFFPRKVKDTVRRYAREAGTDWLSEISRARDLDESLGKRLGAIEHVIGALSEGSMAMQEAISQMRLDEARHEIRTLDRRFTELGPQLESIQTGMGDLSKGSKATQEAITDVRDHADQQIQALAQRLDALGRELSTSSSTIQKHLEALAREVPAAFDQRLQGLDRRLHELQGQRAHIDEVQRLQSVLNQRMDRFDHRLEDLQGQRAHIEEVQRLVTILTDAEAARREPGRLSRALMRPVRGLTAIMAPPFRAVRRPWNRVRSAINASRQHWRVRLARLRPEPKLGRLEHHPPTELDIPKRYLNSKPPANPPSISIVTPSYNQADFLERTIQSVVEQDYPRLEYFVQDGDSNDNTREVLERFGPQLGHWEMRADEGQAQAINRGFARARGEVMSYLNSDDVLLPGALRYIGRYFEAHPDVDVIYGHRVLIDEDDREIGRWVLPRHRDSVLSWADYVPQETLFWRRRVWEKAGGRVDEEFRFAIDWDLLLRLRDAGARIVRVPRFLGAFRVHRAQKTTAEIDMAGADEMSKIRSREHHRDVSPEEVGRELRGYLRRHVALHKLYRAGLIRY
jgi:glycosyltransferase involved in cell wall biosynthesis